MGKGSVKNTYIKYRLFKYVPILTLKFKTILHSNMLLSNLFIYSVFSERGTYVHVRYMLSAVRLSVCRLSSVTLVHSTQPVEIFGNFFTIR